MTRETDPGFVESIEHDGKVARIFYDDDSSHADPRGNDNFGTIVSWSRQVTVGDEQVAPPDFMGPCPSCGGQGDGVLAVVGRSIVTGEPTAFAERKCPACKGNGEVSITLHEWVCQNYGPALCVIPLWTGSGMGISEHDEEDCNAVIFDTAAGRATTGVTLAHTEEALRGELAEYDSWLEGDVYIVEIHEADELDEDGDPIETDDPIDVCHGFIGLTWAQQHAREELGITAAAVAS